MDFIALVVAVVAVVAAIVSATSSSVRNEAHHQVTLIQELLKEISEATHSFFVDMAASPTGEDEASKKIVLKKKALVYELSCSVKCDLLESSLQLLVRRCSRVWFFDAEVETFRSDGIALLGNLRDVLSDCAYSNADNTTAMHKVDANLVRLHVLLNEYIGERFRPIFEHT